MAETSISGIEFKIVGTTTRAKSSVDKLVTSLKGLKSALGSTSTAKMSKELDDLDKHAKKNTTTLGKLFKSIGRIAFYRTIRAALRFITDGFKEGLENAYQFSKMVGYELAGTMDRLATKTLTMKNQLGSAFGSLIQTLEPILLQIISVVTKAANALAQLFAIIGGRDTYLKAVDTMTEYGEAVGGVGQAAKEAMRYLAPFDELNVLPADNGSSGGSGGASTPDYSQMFEVTDVEADSILGSLANMYNSMADWFEAQDWKTLGSSVWEGLNNAFSDEGKAREAVQALFRMIGSVTGAAVGFTWGFISEAVESIMTSFKNSIRDYNGDGKIGITDVLTGIWNFAITPFVWIDENIVKPFWRGFTGALLGEEQEPITVGEFFSWAFRALTDNAITRWIKDNVITPIKNAFSSPFLNDDDNPGKSLGDTILDGIAKPFKAVGAWVKEHIIDPIKEALSGFSISKLLFGDDESGTGGTSGETNIDIKATLTKVGDWSQDVLDVIKEKGGSVTKTVQAALSKASTWVQEAATALGQPNFVTKTVSTALDKAKTWVADAWTALSTKDGSTATKTIMAAVSKAKTWVAEAASALGIPNGSTATKTVSAAVDKAKTWVADAWEAAKMGAQSVVRTVTGNVQKGSGNNWVADAWTAANMKGSTVYRDVDVSTMIYTWDNTAWTAAQMKDNTAWRDVNSSVVAYTWDEPAWSAAQMTGKTTATRNVKVNATAKITKTKIAALNLANLAAGGDVSTTATVTAQAVKDWNNWNSEAYAATQARSKKVTVTVKTKYVDRNGVEIDPSQHQRGSGGNPTMARGGAFYNNRWHEIQQAATGGRFHGSLVWAGENGPEILGHVGGRTEILNQSQLASTMYAAVTRAMAGAQIRVSGMNTPVSADGGYDEETLYRAMLRALNDSDVADSEVTLDGDVLYRKMVQRNQMNTRMTGRNAMATA